MSSMSSMSSMSESEIKTKILFIEHSKEISNRTKRFYIEAMKLATSIPRGETYVTVKKEELSLNGKSNDCSTIQNELSNEDTSWDHYLE